jgi:hypothetical protein
MLDLGRRMAYRRCICHQRGGRDTPFGHQVEYGFIDLLTDTQVIRIDNQEEL